MFVLLARMYLGRGDNLLIPNLARRGGLGGWVGGGLCGREGVGGVGGGLHCEAHDVTAASPTLSSKERLSDYVVQDPSRKVWEKKTNSEQALDVVQFLLVAVEGGRADPQTLLSGDLPRSANSCSPCGVAIDIP